MSDSGDPSTHGTRRTTKNHPNEFRHDLWDRPWHRTRSQDTAAIDDMARRDHNHPRLHRRSRAAVRRRRQKAGSGDRVHASRHGRVDGHGTPANVAGCRQAAPVRHAARSRARRERRPTTNRHQMGPCDRCAMDAHRSTNAHKSSNPRLSSAIRRPTSPASPFQNDATQTLWIDTRTLLPLRWEVTKPEPARVIMAQRFIYESFDLRPPAGIDAPGCIR